MKYTDPHEARKDALVDAQIEKHRLESENQMSKKTEQEYQMEAENLLKVHPHEARVATIVPILKARDERDELSRHCDSLMNESSNTQEQLTQLRDERDELNAELIACSRRAEKGHEITADAMMGWWEESEKGGDV